MLDFRIGFGISSNHLYIEDWPIVRCISNHCLDDPWNCLQIVNIRGNRNPMYSLILIYHDGYLQGGPLPVKRQVFAPFAGVIPLTLHLQVLSITP